LVRGARHASGRFGSHTLDTSSNLVSPSLRSRQAVASRCCRLATQALIAADVCERICWVVPSDSLRLQAEEAFGFARLSR
jgi:hypothetical protein